MIYSPLKLNCRKPEKKSCMLLSTNTDSVKHVNAFNLVNTYSFQEISEVIVFVDFAFNAIAASKVGSVCHLDNFSSQNLYYRFISLAFFCIWNIAVTSGLVLLVCIWKVMIKFKEESIEESAMS